MKVVALLFGCLALASAFLEAPDVLDFAPQISPTHIQSDEHIFRLPFVADEHLSPEGRKNLASSTAIALLRRRFPQKTFTVKDVVPTRHNGMTHVYLRETFQGLEVANSDVNVNLNSKFQVTSFGHNCYCEFPENLEFAFEYTITAEDAVPLFFEFASSFLASRESTKEMILEDVTSVEQTFLQVERKPGTFVPVLTHNFQVKTNLDWWDVHVNAETGEVEAAFNWVKYSTFQVQSTPNINPDLGPRSIVSNPEGSNSPDGWNKVKTTTYTATEGNNVFAQTNPTGGSSWKDNYRPDGGRSLNFAFPIDFSKDPLDYKDAAVANLFYWNNVIHDIFYSAGFDEAGGNFQEYNFGKGGAGNDAVQANAQDGSGFNNANFATPPDGQRPRMRMYIWTSTTPRRDGDIDSGIIIHEYGHGISTRLTGGPSNSNCLGGGQSGGMGEGWSDVWAFFLKQKKGNMGTSSYPIGDYASDNPNGIRYFPYSTDFKIDPQTFGYLNDQKYRYAVHAIGSVWSTILTEVYFEMINSFGFDENLYSRKSGNGILLQNIIDGMKLQPCRPNFVTARNAIMEADMNNYGGKHVCTMWTGFARRGLGYSASVGTFGVTEKFDLPRNCA